MFQSEVFAKVFASVMNPVVGLYNMDGSQGIFPGVGAGINKDITKAFTG